MTPKTKRHTARGRALNAEPLGYCGSLEYALAQLYGMDGPWHGSAGSFRSPARVRAAVRAAAKAIRRRVEDISTADDRLRLLVDSTLRTLERSAGKIASNGAGLLDVAAILIDLTAILVGFDWHVGKPNRELVYHQTREQQLVDDRARYPPATAAEMRIEFTERAEVVKTLYGKRLRVAQIALVMNQPESRIKDILVRSGRIARKANIKEPVGS